ncbi:MAG: VWA domain-containing protein [Flavobacteriales bacterium]
MRADRQLPGLLAWIAAALIAVGATAFYMLRTYELENPLLLWLLGVLLLAAAWVIRRRGKRHPRVVFSAMPGLSGGPMDLLAHLRPMSIAAAMAGLGLLIVALARPQSKDSWQDVTRDGIDIVIAMDFSASMLAKDLKPDRLQAAKNVGMQFIDDRPNDRIGLVVYEGEAFTQCPLTTDHQVLKDLFAQARSGMIDGGTAVGMGLATAVNRLRDSEAKSKVVILLTDGVSNMGSVQPIDAARIAEQFGVRVYTIGVGTRGKALSPVAMYPNGQYQYDYVPVEIDEQSLQGIADATGGKYFRATDERKLREVYSEIDRMEKTRVKVTEHSRRKEEYKPFLFWGCMLMLFSFALDHTILRTMP